MTSEQIRQRSELLGTQVITRDKGKRLGVVSQIWVDIDRREVVAIGLRENFLAIAGIPKFMYLSNVREIGDVILVDDESVVEEDIDIEAYSSLINSEVITETGDLLGRVRGFRFDTESAQLVSLIIASLGIPQIPEQLLSTYDLPIEEIVSSGPNRLIVFEGSEERLKQLSVGVLERIGLGQAPWEREEDGIYYPPTIGPANQLGPGMKIAAQEPIQRTTAPVVEQTWDEEEQWEPPVKQPLRHKQVQPVYDDYEEEDDNWGNDDYEDDYEERYSRTPSIPKKAKEPELEYDDVDSDAWADEEAPNPPYNPPRVNIPEKKKVKEYEEEAGY